MFLLGHSEGCLIAPRAALERPAIAGLVLLCPPLAPIESVLMSQAEQIERDIATMRGVSGLLFRLLVRLTGSPKVAQRELIDRIKSSTSPTLRWRWRSIEAKSLRELMQLDARDIYARVRRPMLVIGGAKDAQCDPADVAEIAALNSQAEPHVIANLTHMLRRDDGPKTILGVGALLHKPVDPEVLEWTTHWLSRRAFRPS